MRTLEETRQFFGSRAKGWEERFPDDEPAYTRAVADLDVPLGGTALDAACGTGRAVPILRRAVGPAGRVVAVDVTPEMLAEAGARGRSGALVLGDVRHLPLPAASVDAVLAAGLVPHLDDTGAGLVELARVTRRGGTLALFHPIGRATLAARHGHRLRPDDVRAEPNIRRLLGHAGWRALSVDDGPDRYLALARRM